MRLGEASIDEGELADKGSSNQKAVLSRRAALVVKLCAVPPPPSIIRAGEAR